MSEALIGIDAGTSTIKVCAFARDGKLLAKAHRAVPVITPYPLWAEIDLERYWELVAEALKEATQRIDRVVSVGIATTCPTTVMLGSDQMPVRPGIVYLDGRSETLINERAGDSDTWIGKAGNRASPSSCWAANVTWVRRNEPEIWGRVRSVMMLNGFLALRLTGRAGIEPTQASFSGLMDVSDPAAAWSEDLVRLWELDPSLLPDLIGSADRIGVVTAGGAAATGLPPGVPVALGAGDTAAAAFAIGATQAGDVFESAGTSGVITYCLDKPELDAAFLNRFHVTPGRWLAHGAMSTLGGSFGWLNHKVWPEIGSLAELERLAEQSVPGANGLIFLPYLSGERTPIWDAEASAAWIGLRLSHTRQDMVRAAFEGAAFGLRQILLKAEERWNYRPNKLVGVGAGARSRFWAQIKADILKLDYAMAETVDASALGAALLGGVAAGLFSDTLDSDLPKIRTNVNVIHPGPQNRQAIYDRLSGIFDALYPSLRDSMHALAVPVSTNH